MHEVFFRSRFHSETTAHIASVPLNALDDALEERKTDARGSQGSRGRKKQFSYENDPNDEPRPEKERDKAMEKMISTAPNRERKI